MGAGSSSVCSLSRLSAPLMLHEMKGLCWSCSRTGIHSWSTRFIPAAQVQAPATHPAAPVGLYLRKSASDQKLRGFTGWLQVEICLWVREASSFHAKKPTGKPWKNCSSSCLGHGLDAGMGSKFLILPGLSTACHRLSQCQCSTFATAATSFPSRQPEISSCLLRQILPKG